jgi:hypothetical protein
VKPVSTGVINQEMQQNQISGPLTDINIWINCDQKAMSLPPYRSAVFLIAMYFLVKRGRLGRIFEMPTLPLRGLKREWYICIINISWVLRYSHCQRRLS